jgi:DNA segregation ATPase FtsK/SpoIIIE-like protein
MSTENSSLQNALEVLLQEQREAGKPVIDYPISLLQRRLRLRYTCAVALMRELKVQSFVETINETTIKLLLTPEQNSS